jgi:hypothetical protein
MTAPQEPGSNPRRAFIAAAGAGVAGLGFTAIAPGLHLMAVGQADAAEVRKAGSAASPAVRWGLLIDAGKCAPGCTKCVDACHTENGVSEKCPIRARIRSGSARSSWSTGATGARPSCR